MKLIQSFDYCAVRHCGDVSKSKFDLISTSNKYSDTPHNANGPV